MIFSLRNIFIPVSEFVRPNNLENLMLGGVFCLIFMLPSPSFVIVANDDDDNDGDDDNNNDEDDFNEADGNDEGSKSFHGNATSAAGRGGIIIFEAF
jgi:hypothetical protein